MTFQTATSKSPAYTSIKNDLTVFANIFCILDKIENDSNLTDIFLMFKKIFQDEVFYTIKGEFNRT